MNTENYNSRQDTSPSRGLTPRTPINDMLAKDSLGRKRSTSKDNMFKSQRIPNVRQKINELLNEIQHKNGSSYAAIAKKNRNPKNNQDSPKKIGQNLQKSIALSSKHGSGEGKITSNINNNNIQSKILPETVGKTSTEELKNDYEMYKKHGINQTFYNSSNNVDINSTKNASNLSPPNTNFGIKANAFADISPYSTLTYDNDKNHYIDKKEDTYKRSHGARGMFSPLKKDLAMLNISPQTRRLIENTKKLFLVNHNTHNNHTHVHTHHKVSENSLIKIQPVVDESKDKNKNDETSMIHDKNNKIAYEMNILKTMIKDRDSEISKLRLLINTKNDNFALEKTKYMDEIQAITKVYEDTLNEIDKLRIEINQIKKEKENLVNTLQDYRKQLESTSEGHAIINKISERSKSILDLRVKYKEQQDLIEDLREQLVNSEGNCEPSQNEKELTEKNKELDELLKLAIEEHDKLLAEQEKIIQENEKLKNDNKFSNNLLEKLEKSYEDQIKILKDNMSVHTRDLETYKKENKQLYERLNQMKYDNKDDLLAKYAKLQQDYTTLNQDFEKQKTQLKLLKQSKNINTDIEKGISDTNSKDLRKSHNANSNESDDIKDKYSKLLLINQNMSEDLLKLTEENEDLKKALQTSQNSSKQQHQRRSSRLSDDDVALNALKMKLEAYEISEGEYRLKIQDLEGKLKLEALEKSQINEEYQKYILIQKEESTIKENLRKENENLIKENENLIKENENLKKERENLLVKITEYEQKLKEMTSSYDKLNDTLKLKQAELEYLQLNLQGMKDKQKNNESILMFNSKIESMQNDINRLKDKLENQVKANEELNRENRDIKHKLDEAHDEHKILQDKLSTLSADITSSDEYNKLLHEINQYSKEVEHMRNENMELVKQLKEKDEICESMLEKLKELAELEQAKQDMMLLISEFENQARALAEKNAIIQHLEEKVGELMHAANQTSNPANVISNLENELNNLNEELAKKIKENDDIFRRFEEIRHDYEELEGKYNTVVKANSKKDSSPIHNPQQQKQIDQLQAEIQKKVTDLDQKSKESKQLSAELQREKQNTMLITKQFNEAKKHFELLETNYKTQISDLENKLNETESKMKNILGTENTDNNKVKKLLEEKNEELMNMKIEFDEITNKYQNLQIMHNQLLESKNQNESEQIIKLRQICEDSREEANHLKDQIVSLQQNETKIRDMLNDKENKIKKLENDLSVCQNSLAKITEEKSSAESLLAEAEKYIQENEEETKKLEKAKSEIEEALKKKNQEVETLKQELELTVQDAEKEISEAEALLEKKSNEYNELEKKYNDLLSNNTNKKNNESSEIIKLRKELTENNNKYQELLKYKAQFEELQEKYNQAENMNKELNAMIDEAANDLDKNKAEIEKLTEEKAKVDAEIETLINEFQEFHEENEKNKQTLEIYQQEKQELTTRIEELTKKIESKLLEKDGAQANGVNDNKELHEAYEKSIQMNELLQEELKNCKDEMSRIQKELAAHELTIEEEKMIIEQFEELTRENEELKEKLVNMDSS